MYDCTFSTPTAVMPTSSVQCYSFGAQLFSTCTSTAPTKKVNGGDASILSLLQTAPFILGRLDLGG